MTEIATRPPVVEGYIDPSPAQRLAAGTDLDFVLGMLDAVDPIELESEDPSDTDYQVHYALNYVRAEIRRRLAVQAGPDAVGEWCGVDGDHGRACGSDLGLPDCRAHSTCARCGLNAKTGDLFWFRDHGGGRCPQDPGALTR